jgi:DNA-binding CsgD family transcriptional regulator
MAYSKEREAIWHTNLTREKDYYEVRAELSLIKKGIRNPSPLQLRLETLLLLHKNLSSDVFLGDLSEQELSCILLAAWGVEIKGTAKILKIKEDSVHKFHARVSQKLNAKNVPHSVYKASQAGILTVDNIDFLLHPKNKKIPTIPINKKIKEVENTSF